MSNTNVNPICATGRSDRSRRSTCCVFALLLIALTGVSSDVATAASFTWSGDSTTNQLWSNGANWAGTAPTSNATTDLIFAGTTNTGTLLNPLNQNIANPMTLRSITFDSTAGNFFLGGNQIAAP